MTAAAGLLLAAPCGAAAARGVLRGGLHGRVCVTQPPVAIADQLTSCLPRRVPFLLVRPGRRYLVRPAADGAYRVALPAGAYRVELPFHVGVRAPRVRPFLVRVRPGRDDRVDLYLDVRFAAQASSRTVSGLASAGRAQ